MAGDVIGPNFVESQMPDGFAQLFQVNVLRDHCVRLLARCCQPLLVSLLNVVRELWAPAYVPQPVLTPLHKQRSEFLLSRSRRLRTQGHPLDRLAPGVVFDGDPGDELAVAPPEAANCVLAIVQDLGVVIAS